MKSRFITRTSTASLAVFALCLAGSPAVMAQFPSPGQPGYQPVEVVTPQTQAFAVTHLAGKPVRGSNQEELGTISDFLIDARSGRVHFAIVTAGGNTFRIVPMSALQQGSGTQGLVLALDRARWDQINTMSEQELLNRVTIDTAQQQRLQEQFQLPAGEAAAPGLIRATLLNERELRAGNDQIGTVDDVVIDFHNRIAAPLVKMKAGSAAGEERVLVHFSHLQVNPDERSPITANLNPNDFRQVQSSQLSPTGHPGAFGQQRSQWGDSAAMAIQQALDRDTSARGAVQAVHETRIVLRGAVESEQKKSEIEQAAQQAAPGVRIENQLMVRNR